MACATRSARAVSATSCDPDDAAPGPPRHRAGEAALEAVVDLGVEQRPEEALARRAHEHGPSEPPQLPQPVQQGEVVLRGLREADPRVDEDALGVDPRRHAAVEPGGEELVDLGEDVVVGRLPGHVLPGCPGCA
jgi:hypothetical protein